MKEKIRQYFLEHREDILKDIASLVEINSVRSEAKEGMPFGEGAAGAVAEAEKIAKRMGFATKNFDNYALTINSDPSCKDAYLGILCHLDVVAEGTGWTREPFKMTIEGDSIYGRGVSDDKGPAVTALWALKACNDLGIKLSKNVRIILGSDEECGSSDLDYYFKKEAQPAFCFSPDADFPIYNCEKGRFSTTIRGSYENRELPALISFEGGHTSNIVAQHSEAVAEGISLDAAKAAAKKWGEATKTEIEAVEEGTKIRFICNGLSAHASTPGHGINAVTALLQLLADLGLKGDLGKYIKGLSTLFPHGDFLGEAIGIKREDEISGPLTCSFNILNIENGSLAGVFDIRSPICSNEENTSLVMKKNLAEYSLTLDSTEMVEPHYVDENLPFIKILSKSYEDFTDRKGECLSMGGGTYVHHIENGVAFGPTMPGTETNIHGPDEVASIDDLLTGAMIYTEVIANMCR